MAQARPEIHLSEEAKAALEAANKISCAKCVHFRVCEISHAFIGMSAHLNEAAGNGEKAPPPPVNPMDLAKICREYAPNGGMGGMLTA